MKLAVFFTGLLGIAMAVETTVHVERTDRSHKRAPRPRFIGVEVRVPSGPAPAGYSTSVSKPTLLRSKATLAKVSSRQTVRRQDQPGAADFFECTNPNPSPSTADCKVVVDQVLSTDDELIIAPNSCLVFSYRTCQGFFCSLCETLSTSTQFIGSQLDTVDALCVEGGQAGTIVGENAPQWDAGLTYAGQGLPTFDVC